ncbi:MAG: hypothetical protein V2A78_05295, partial [bacterium]
MKKHLICWLFMFLLCCLLLPFPSKAEPSLIAGYKGSLIQGNLGDKEKSEILTRRGVVFFHIGNYKEAEKLFKLAVKLDRQNVKAIVGLALTYESSDRIEKAICCFNKAINSDAGCIFAYESLGDIYAYNKQYKRAIANYKKAIAFQYYGTPTPLYYKLGRIYDITGNKIKAIYYYDQYLAVEHSQYHHGDLAKERLKKLAKNKNYFECKKLYKEALSLIDCLKYKEAGAIYLKAIKNSPLDLISRFQVGNMYGKHDNIKEAISMFSETIKMAPQMAESYIERAGYLRNPEATLRDYIKAYELDDTAIQAILTIVEFSEQNIEKMSEVDKRKHKKICKKFAMLKKPKSSSEEVWKLSKEIYNLYNLNGLERETGYFEKKQTHYIHNSTMPLSNIRFFSDEVKIAFVSAILGDREVFVMDCEGKKKVNVSNSPAYEDETPFVSPSGN